MYVEPWYTTNQCLNKTLWKPLPHFECILNLDTPNTSLNKNFESLLPHFECMLNLDTPKTCLNKAHFKSQGHIRDRQVSMYNILVVISFDIRMLKLVFFSLIYHICHLFCILPCAILLLAAIITVVTMHSQTLIEENTYYLLKWSFRFT